VAICFGNIGSELALSEELEGDRPVIPVNVLGEKLATYKRFKRESVLMGTSLSASLVPI